MIQSLANHRPSAKYRLRHLLRQQRYWRDGDVRGRVLLYQQYHPAIDVAGSPLVLHSAEIHQSGAYRLQCVRLQNIAQLIRGDWFHQMMIETGRLRSLPIEILPKARDGYKTSVLKLRIATEAACQLVATDAGQANIQQQRIGLKLFGFLQSFLAAEGNPDLIPFDPQQINQHFSCVTVVIDHQNAMTRWFGRRAHVIPAPPRGAPRPPAQGWPPLFRPVSQTDREDVAALNDYLSDRIRH